MNEFKDKEKEMRDQIKTLELEKKRLLEKMNVATLSHKESSETAERLAKDFQKLEEKVTTLEAANRRLESQFQKKDGEIMKLQDKLKDANKYVEDVKEEMLQRNKNLEKQKSSYDKEISYLTEEIAVLRVEKMEYAKSAGQSEGTSVKEMVRLKKICKSDQKKFEAQHKEILRLQLELDQRKEKMAEAKVHRITQTVEKEEKGKKVEVSSVILRIKNKPRTKKEDSDYVYTGTDLRKAIIDLDKENEKKPKEIERTMKIADKREAYECGKHLRDETLNTIREKYQELGDWAKIWERNNEDCKVKDIVNVLEGNYISSNVVNAFSMILEDYEKDQNKFHIFQQLLP